MPCGSLKSVRSDSRAVAGGVGVSMQGVTPILFEQPSASVNFTTCFCCVPQVSPLGDMVLDSGDNHSPQRRAAFNIALSHFNIAIREAPGAAPDAQPSWSVSEGHRLTRFTDGMKIASRGPLTANRAAVLMAAYGEGLLYVCPQQQRVCTAASLLPACWWCAPVSACSLVPECH